MEYFIGRLMWEKVATYKEINNWLYSPDELLQMHELLDLKDSIENRAIKKAMESSSGN